MRIVWLFTAFLICAVSQSAAQEKKPDETISTSHLAAAYETVLIARVTRAYSEIIPNLARQARAQLVEKYPAIKREVARTVDETAIKLAERQGELERLIALQWARRFSEDELRDITAFYATPIGSKLSKMNTELIAVTLEVAQLWGARMASELVRQVQEKLKAKGHKL